MVIKVSIVQIVRAHIKYGIISDSVVLRPDSFKIVRFKERRVQAKSGKRRANDENGKKQVTGIEYDRTGFTKVDPRSPFQYINR